MIVKLLISSLLVLASANSLADSVSFHKTKDGKILLTNRDSGTEFKHVVTHYKNGVKIAEEITYIPIEKYSTSTKNRTVTSNNSAPNTPPKYQSTDNLPHTISNSSAARNYASIQNSYSYGMKNGAYVSTHDEINQAISNLSAHAKQKDNEREQQANKKAKSK